MRQPSPSLSFHDVKLLAAAMRHPLMHAPSGQRNASEAALQPRRRLMSALATAAKQFTSSENQLAVLLCLKRCLILTLQPIPPLIVS